MSEMPLLQVKNLHTSFFTDAGEVYFLFSEPRLQNTIGR